jgi:hypothetical protein
MSKLTREDLWSLEEYSVKRPDFRTEVLAHKKNRQLQLSDNARLLFEDTLTLRYQIQEMLRIEKLFEEAEILDELNAYNPLIPDGSNWKATLMIEISEVPERRRRLQEMVGIEHRVWMQVGSLERVFAIADEDMDRSTEDKTSSVHFLRFELSQPMVAGALKGMALHAGVDHPACHLEPTRVSEELRRALAGDRTPVAH